MEPSARYPASMKAEIDPSAIRKVSRFFNASLLQIMNEMFQNARRSGASRVDVTTTPDTIVIADDGAGIADPQSVLAFGRSTWLDASVEAEDPAGMGVFSLARRNSRITSRPRDGHGWGVDLDPAHFLGQKAADIDTGCADGPADHGTRIQFAATESEEQVEKTINHCAKFYPLPVTLNGSAVKQEDFLAGATHQTIWNGSRIAVYKTTSGPGRSNLINFHGQTLTLDVLPEFKTDQTGTHAGNRWSVNVDMQGSPGLELTLPGRGELVQNEALTKLIDAAKKAVFLSMLAENAQNIPHALVEDAQRLGIELTKAAPRLQLWQPIAAEPFFQEDDDLILNEPEIQIAASASEKPILMTAQLEHIDQQVLYRGLVAAGLASRTFHPRKKYVGYDWYDKMTRLSAIAISWRLGDEIEHLDSARENTSKSIQGRPEEIEIVVTLERPHGRASQRRLPVDVVCISETATACDEVSLLLTENATISADQLADILVDGYFIPYDGLDADSPTTQCSEFERDAKELATGLTRSWTEARIERLQELAKAFLGREVNKGETIHFRIDDDENVDVTIVTDSPRKHADEGSDPAPTQLLQ